jgi:hypothetical protein
LTAYATSSYGSSINKGLRSATFGQHVEGTTKPLGYGAERFDVGTDNISAVSPDYKVAVRVPRHGAQRDDRGRETAVPDIEEAL